MSGTQQQAALALLQQAHDKLYEVDALMTKAITILETDGGFVEHDIGDVCGVVHDGIGELEQLVSEHVKS